MLWCIDDGNRSDSTKKPATTWGRIKGEHVIHRNAWHYDYSHCRLALEDGLVLLLGFEERYPEGVGICRVGH